MKTNLAVLPFFIPLVTAALLFLVSKTKMLRNTIAMISSLVQVFVSFIVLSALKTQDLIFLPLGGWKVPYGITITIDHISAVMVALCTVVSLVCIIYTLFEKKLVQFGYHLCNLLQRVSYYRLQLGISLTYLLHSKLC